MTEKNKFNLPKDDKSDQKYRDRDMPLQKDKGQQQQDKWKKDSNIKSPDKSQKDKF